MLSFARSPQMHQMHWTTFRQQAKVTVESALAAPLTDTY
jgi:hypothetical protein